MAYTTLNKMVTVFINIAVLLIISFFDVESMTKIVSNVCENSKLFDRKILDELQ